MKHPILFFCFLLLLFSTLFSCRPNRSSYDLLMRAETLIDKYPDSTLILLRKVNSGALDKSDNARYCLLMTKALFKNSIPIVSDSLISIALDYYNNSGDSLKKAETYFYFGQVNADMKNSKLAMESLLKAADFASYTRNYKLLYLIYYYLGDLHLNEFLYGPAIKMHQKALSYSKLLNDSSYITHALRNLAISYAGDNKKDSALINYYLALKVIPKSDTATLIALYNEMGGVYENLGNYTLAIESVNKALALDTSTEDPCYSYVTKAHTYLKMEKYDSAIYYYNKTIYSTNLYTRASCYNGLAEAYYAKGNSKKAFLLMNTFNKYRDTIENQTKTAAVVEVQNIYQHGKAKEQIQRLLLEKKEQTIAFYHWGLLSFILLLLLSGSFFIYRSRNKKELLEKSRMLLEQENKLIRMREKESQLREDFFKKLNKLNKIPSLGLNNAKNKESLSDDVVRISLTDRDWDELIRNIDVAYDHFTDRLKREYPNLTLQEIHLCCLVKIKVARNDLANIFCITPQSVKTTKYRIKKEKMGILDRDISLDLFLEKF
ncbi:Tetratricopeptide repeat-containing protein [Bacteroides luti]|uniref:Tetratricopeptide repeat-containing protein n=1 Tax=Bacteroides luti TaxID=1297750 RepID=A0A1M5A6D3_9BACE|nr:tetratricopeptide repeat protein [Bacteroides luti]SHF25889.1 Tetratricopeptide repeat-containing protein [Bacteroides luti]